MSVARRAVPGVSMAPPRRPLEASPVWRTPHVVREWFTPLASEHLALERYIVLIRWLGALLCVVLVPFLGLRNVGWVYWCLLGIAAYNLAFSRLVRSARPMWLLRLYVYGVFDTVAASTLIALTAGVASPFFPAYFLIVVHAGIRFGRNAAVLTAGLISAWCLLLLRGDDDAAVLLLRVGFIVLTALFAGVLSDRTRAAEADVAEQLRRTRALHDAGAALAGAVQWSDVLQLVVQQARRLADVEIALLDILTAGATVPTERVTDVAPVGAYLAKLILQNRKRVPGVLPAAARVTCTRLTDATDLVGDVAPAMPTSEVLHASVPLQHRSVGDLVLVRVAGRPPFCAADVATLQAFLDQAGLALERAALYERVQEQAATDYLTGLPNHRALKERLDDELARARRAARSFVVLMLDLDGFKAYNDTYGHAAGDRALQAVATVLQGVTRRGTAVSRYGGEEFVMLLPDADLADGLAVAERIRLNVARCGEADDDALPQQITVSIGVATYPEHGGDRDALLQAADLAMYLAKQLGRNRVCTANELSTLRGAEALVGQITQQLFGSPGEWGPHIITALERRFLRFAALTSTNDARPESALTPGMAGNVQLVTALAAAIDAKDHYTNGHSEHVAHLASQLARAAGQSGELVELVRVAGQLHDIGKIGVPEAILHKPGALTDDEWTIMRLHPDIGARILAPIASLSPVIGSVKHHHEWWNGQGYPAALAGEAIPLGARIIAICDAYDTLVSNRPYRQALDRQEAIERLRASAGTQFDPALVGTFIALHGGQAL